MCEALKCLVFTRVYNTSGSQCKQMHVFTGPEFNVVVAFPDMAVSVFLTLLKFFR